MLVQIRLLQHDIQSAPPIKDSGNDLIAVKQNVFRAIQVKTTTGFEYQKGKLPKYYHIMAVVQLCGSGQAINLDQSRVFLVPKNNVKGLTKRIDGLAQYEISPDWIDLLFAEGSA